MATSLSNVLTKKTASFVETLPPDKDHPSGTYTLSYRGGVNPLSDTYRAVKTLNDDPGNHKKKALGYLGLAAAGAGANYYLNNHTKYGKYLNLRAPSSRLALLGSLLSAGLIYYGVRNKDNALKQYGAPVAGLGLSQAAYSIDKDPVITDPSISEWLRIIRRVNNGTASQVEKSTYATQLADKYYSLLGKIPTGNATDEEAKFFSRILLPQYERFQGSTVLNLASNAATIAGIASSADEFQQAEDIERIRAIQADPKLTPAQRKKYIYDIDNKNTFTTRYPIARWIPGSDVVRDRYDDHFGYSHYELKR